MKFNVIVAAAALALLVACVQAIHARYAAEINEAADRARRRSLVLDTRCGPIEYQQAGTGLPLLVVHGSGGGHDQAMAFAHDLVAHGIRVIAMSRFGYLRTPMPPDASPQAQADAHACLMDALGLPTASVLGLSAGAPSAMQTAIRHPERVQALVLVVPIVPAKGPPQRDRARFDPSLRDRMLMQLLGSDFVFWVALRVARDSVIRHVLATAPELVAQASTQERARVDRMADQILPVSIRAAGLRADTSLGHRLEPYPLERIRAPALVVSARDDLFDTFPRARDAAQQIQGARFLGYERGGHLLVGHDEAVRSEIIRLLHRHAHP